MNIKNYTAKFPTLSPNIVGEKLKCIEFLYMLLLCIVYMLPSAGVQYTVYLLLSIGYIAYLSIYDKPLFTFSVRILVCIAVLAFFYAVLTDARSIASDVSNRMLKRFISKLYQYLSLYFPLIMFHRVHCCASIVQKKILAALSLLLIVYVMITTWSILAMDTNATRNWGGYTEYSDTDMATYYYIYAIPIVISIATASLSKLNGVYKAASLLFIVFSLVFLVNAQYTLSIIISILGIIYQSLKSFRLGVGKVIYVVALIFLCVFVPDILMFAIEHINSVQVTIRLREIHTFLTGGGAGGYNLNGRLTLYWKSILAFFQSPIWGNRDVGFDGHATFLTVLSDTGLLGGIPFYALLYIAVKKIRLLIGNCRDAYKSVFLMFVLMGLTNPVHASMPLGFAVWFLAPLTITILFNKENAKNEHTALEN